MIRLQNMSLKRKLITAFLLILFVPVILITAVSYLNTKQQIMNEQQTGASESLSLLNDNLTATIQPKLEQVDFLANYITKNDVEQNRERVNNLLREYLAMHTDVAIAYIGTTEGEMVREPYYEYDADYNPRVRPWYTQAMEQSGKIIITDPYVSSSTGELVITIARQLKDQSGVLGIDVSIQTIVDIANSVSIGNAGFITIIDNANNYIAKPDVQSGTASEERYVTELTTASQSSIFDGYTVTYEPNEVTGWKLYSNALNKEAVDAARKTLVYTLAIVLICLALGSVIAYYTITSILRPIRKLTEMATAISNGDLTKAVITENYDEFGILGQKFESMRQSLVHLITEVFNSAQNVKNASKQLHTNADETMHATNLSTTSIQEIASILDSQMAANEQNVQTMVSMEQSITSIADNSAEISALSQNALNNATYGAANVQRTVNQMHTISHAVQDADETVRNLSTRITEIDSIVEVIAGIANQTNLLALNASIEAARAGEHGKGFAVVAQEVGKLAANSQTSTQQINALIASIQQDTHQSVQHMTDVITNVQSGLTLTNETAEQFTMIVQALEQITPMIERISTNTQSLAAAAEQATAGATELASQSQQNTASVEAISAVTEQIHHAMQEISGATDALQQLAITLISEVERFKV